MGFQFAETMAGTVEWDADPGTRHPFRFEVTAAADSIRQHLRDGKAQLTGVVYAPPYADGADADGTITIRPLGQKVIRYELAFVADDGTPYTLVGQKDIRFLAPRRSFTELPAEIVDDHHRRVARCQTTFDLQRDWWEFLRSFQYVR